MNQMRLIEIDEPKILFKILSETGLSEHEIENWVRTSSQFILKTHSVGKSIAKILMETMIALGGNGMLFEQNGCQSKVILLGDVNQYDQLVAQLDDRIPGNENITEILKERLIDFSELKSFELHCGNKKLNLSTHTHVMGILNATPDSFFDGGRYFNHERAVQKVFKMVAEGADLIDIGGESTRPGSDTVDIDEEIRRVVPIIEQIKDKITVPISIDTRKSEVAEAAIESGARMVNDVSGLRFDSKMASIVEKYHVPVVIMHMKGSPKNMQVNPEYTDLIGEVYDQLEQSIQIALEHGISRNKIVIDPGIGFGKKWDDNFLILKRLKEFKRLGYPILIGVSRKSFIGRALDLEENERLMGTAAAVAVSSLKGAEIVRVHDVKEMVQVVRIVDRLR